MPTVLFVLSVGIPSWKMVLSPRRCLCGMPLLVANKPLIPNPVPVVLPPPKSLSQRWLRYPARMSSIAGALSPGSRDQNRRRVRLADSM